MTAGRSDWLLRRLPGIRARAVDRSPLPGLYLAGHFARFWSVDPSKLAKSSTSAQAEASENAALPAFFTADKHYFGRFLVVREPGC
jgi:hypothetical protein